MGIISSVFLNKHKCQRLYGKTEAFCIYGVDIAMCVTILLLLFPQIVVVRLFVLCKLSEFHSEYGCTEKGLTKGKSLG